MVKNLPTIERSTKIRFGKHATDDQAENTVVFNASNVAINAINEGSIYMAPLRVAELAGSNLVGYSSLTKEIVDSSVPTSLLGGVTLDSATVQGNIVSNAIPHFANTLTAFTTGHGSNVGISNTAPTHMLSVGDKIFMSNTGAEAIKVEGNVRANRFFSGSSVMIDGNSTNKIQVSGTIKTGALHADNIGIANTSPTHALSLGNEGQLRLNVPTESIYALETVGNVSAQNYIGDGGLLSNVTLQTVTDKSNVTSNTLLLTNPTTSLKAYSNVIVDGTLDVGSNLYVNDTAANVLDVTGNVNVSNYLKTNKLEVTSLEVDAVTAGTVSSNIVGNNVNVITVTANVVADNVVATNISSITLNSNVVADNVVATNIGLNSTNSNVLLLGPVSGTTTLVKLQPYTANSTKKFLRSNDAGVAWDDVSSTLDAVASNGPAGANVTSNTIQFTNGVTSLTASGNVVVSGNVTTGTPIAIASGGTGQSVYTQGDILYSDTANSLAKLAIGSDSEYKVLQVKSDGTVPEWTSTITSATLSNPSLTGTITATGLSTNRIPFTNGSGQLVSDTKLQFDGVDTMTIGSNLTISGNLLVQGNTTFQHTQNHTISDPLIELGNANASDTIDMGVIMTRPTANVVAGYMGDEKKYVIAYTLSDPLSPHIVPTNETTDEYMTLSVEGGNVLAGNVTTTGTVEAVTLKGDSVTVSGAVTGDTLVGSGSAITNIDAEKITTGVLDVDHGGTNIASYTAGDLLYATGATTLAKLGVDNGKFLKSTGSAVQWADVSSTLQAITTGGATTTHTIAFNNATTGLTSAGDIDIAATKQIDYTGDVLLKSSAGAIASLKVTNAIKLDPAYAAPSNNVLSFDVSTGEIYDSGGQGGSTLDNIHEEGANVAIGPSTASANLTVNTYGSNVLTVSGNVSADSITIGNLNVAASPFALDDVVSVNAGANVTANVLTLGGLVTSGNVDASNITISGNTTSQNIKLTNTDISATISSGTITIDAREKSYGTAPLVVSTTDVSSLVFSNLITGAQIVVPILASGGDINISKELTNVNFYAMTTDVSITQDKHALMTLSNLYGNIYMNAIGFA